MWPGVENRPVVRRVFFTFLRYAMAHDYVRAIDVSVLFCFLESVFFISSSGWKMPTLLLYTLLGFKASALSWEWL